MEPNFQESSICPTRSWRERPTYSDYFRILAERGEFGTDNIEGELSRRLQNRPGIARSSARDPTAG